MGLQNGVRVSLWRCLLLTESENILFETDSSLITNEAGVIYLSQNEVIEKLKYIVHEPRDSTCLRIVLLARGEYFAGCVFDGNSLVAHQTFHRYVIRAKTGKKQSSEDAGGRRTIHSAGASLHRYNELGLKKCIEGIKHVCAMVLQCCELESQPKGLDDLEILARETVCMQYTPTFI